MRFSKRNKNWAAAGRRLTGDRRQGETGAVATEERNALLGGVPGDPGAGIGVTEETALTGDPTQHLLTALGRFQRQVSKAESGAPQESWSDECMNQLIRGIEIAHGQNWDGVQEALTDTARILQSYEDAGRAQACVSFLQDSYEILCLMVGDLIVDNVRSGVLQKWRDRYQQALSDLAKAGLSLVEDEEEEGAAAESVEETPAAAPEIEEPRREEMALETDDAWQWEEPAPPTPPAAPAGARSEDLTEAIEFLQSDQPESGSVFSETGPRDGAPVEEEEAALSSDLFEEERVSTSAEESAAPPMEEFSPFSLPSESPRENLEDENLPSLDDLLEIGAGAAPKAERQADFVWEAPEDIERAASQPEESRPAGLKTEEDAEGAEETAKEPPAPAAEAIAGAPAVVDNTAETLLQTAQEAMARGDVADAKIFALRLAANMAHLEVARSEEQLAQAEARLAENAQAISSAGEAVSRSEQAVEEAARIVGERRTDSESVQGQAGALRERLSGIEDVIADLDEQIRALQARRAEEVERRESAQAELDGILGEESRLHSELDGLVEAEEGARAELQAARERVAALEQQRIDQEAAIAAARGDLERRRKSAADIERTIEDILGGAVTPSAKTDATPS